MHAGDVVRGRRLARPQPHVGRDEKVVVRNDAHQRPRDAVPDVDETKARKIVDSQRHDRRRELIDRDCQIEDEESHQGAEGSVPLELAELDRNTRSTRIDLVARAQRLPGDA